MKLQDRATTISARQQAAADLARAGAALFGPDFKAPLAAALSIKTSTLDDMTKGRSSIPSRMWSEVAALLQDREEQLPAIKAKAFDHAAQPVHRLYRGPGGIEFGILPDTHGRWPRVMYSSVGIPISRNWIALDDGERRLPDNAAAFRLEFEGEMGKPIELFLGGEIDYPKNFGCAA